MRGLAGCELLHEVCPLFTERDVMRDIEGLRGSAPTTIEDCIRGRHTSGWRRLGVQHDVAEDLEGRDRVLPREGRDGMDLLRPSRRVAGLAFDEHPCVGDRAASTRLLWFGFWPRQRVVVQVHSHHPETGHAYNSRTSLPGMIFLRRLFKC